jgi:drug/metabolite transporter (DMT)-like permease
MSQPDRSHPSAGAIWLALSAVYVIWSTTFVGIKVTNETLPPMLAGGVRFLVAGGLLLPIALRFGDRRGDRPTATQWRGASVVGLLLMFGGNGGIVWAERTIDSHVAGLAIATVPLWIALIDRVVLHRRQRPIVLAGLAVGFVGTVILIGGGAVDGDIDPAGLFIALAAAASWAAGSIYQRHAPLPRRPFVAAGMEMLVAAACFTVAAAAAGELADLDLAGSSRASVIALAYLVIFGSWIGFTCYLWLLRVARTSLVATYAYVTPVGALFVGWLLLGERIEPVTILAGAMIVVSVALIVSAGGAAQRAPASGGGDQRRAQLEPELPLQGAGSTEQRLLTEHGGGDLEPDREPR